MYTRILPAVWVILEWSFGSAGYLTSNQQRSKRQLKETAAKMSSVASSSSSDPSTSDPLEVLYESTTVEIPKRIEGYHEGPHPLISDSLFSLIILIYVAITFSYIFYAFCWRSPDPPKEDDKNLPMITDMLNEVEHQTKPENE